MLGVAASCGGQHKAPVKGAVPLEPKAYTLQDALAELDALVKPESVDAKVWEELKDALKEALMVEGRGLIPRRNSPESGRRGVKRPPFSPDSEIQIPEPGWSARRALKIVSTPPLGAANRVNDLTATRETNGDFTLSWHYRNLGDYNQDGVVGVSDITPLAMHYNETYDLATQPDCIQAVVDGSGNGKIGVEDVTQIAQNFGTNVAQYSVQGADQQQGAFTHSRYMPLPAEGLSVGRIAFTINLGDQPAYTYWRVVPEDAEGNPGDASNVVALNVEAPVRVLGVTPLSGMAGAEVTFTAFVAGTGPFTYEWNFGGGATPNTSTAAQPIVTLNNDAVDTEYSAQVKVTGASGSATRHFTLTVTTLPGNPPVINSVGPFCGLSGEQLNFTADVSGDEPLTYSWEFDGGASPPVSAEVSPTAILGRGGTLPAPDIQYPCRLTVTNASGSASADFTLTVSAQWHLIEYVNDARTGEFIDTSVFSPGGVLCRVKRENAPGNAYYMQYENGEWTSETIPYYWYCRLAFNPLTNDVAAACLTGGVDETPYYVYRSSEQWYSEEVGAPGMIDGFGMRLAFHKDGTPVMAWSVAGDKSRVAFAEKSSGTWQVEYIPAGDISIGLTSLIVDDQDQAVAAVSDLSGIWAAWIAIKQIDGWQMEKVPEYGSYSELISKPDGSLQLSLVREPPYPAPRVLSFAVFSGSTWTIEDADTGASPALLNKPVLLSDGTPLLLCSSDDYETNAEEFRASWRTPGGWISARLFPQAGNAHTWEGKLLGVDSSGTLAVQLTETADTTPVTWWNYYGLFW